ncbi:cytochrome P450 family protein [Ceratobasidium sp. AG-Ba]|nr:cytochrome P450 family protein [Ceratobasidium sp. AG-Ba]
MLPPQASSHPVTVGNTRKPVLEDLPRLPYVQAIIKEVHRWRPTVPMAPPHASLEEINYAGYRIPAGTTIFTNTWGMSHDPDIYDRPESFWPDRWIRHEFGLKAEAEDLKTTPTWFGMGRRVCPGIHLANNSPAINALNLLWAFEFSPELDEHTGEPVKVDVDDFEEGFALAPKPFKCNISPRSSCHAEIIEQEFSAARHIFEQYERHGFNEDSIV